jgi:hypothetical protein
MAKRRYPEQQIHIAIVRGLRYGLPKDWIVTHFANGGKRTEDEARLFKAMGVLAGLPDIIVLGQTLGKPAVWFLEVKAPKGRLEPVQADMCAALGMLGFRFAVVRSVDDALSQGREWGWPLRAAIALQPASEAA